MSHLSALLQRLVEARVEFVLVGGYAAVAHGASLMTRDVDVCCRFTLRNLQRLQRALSDLHPVHRLTPQKLPLEITPSFCRELRNLYLQTDWGNLDCLGEVLGVGDFDTVQSRSIEVAVPGGMCPVLDIAALIEAKKAMGRDHDKLTVTQLEAIRERGNTQV